MVDIVAETPLRERRSIAVDELLILPSAAAITLGGRAAAQVVDGVARHRDRVWRAAPTRLTAWSTVVWLRPPKPRPISGRLWSVSSRARYMATWRAVATAGRRSRARSACRSTPNSLRRGVEDLGDAARSRRRRRPRGARGRGARGGRGLLARAARRRRPPGSARPRARGRWWSRGGDLVRTASGELDAVEAGALGEDRPADVEAGRLELHHEPGAEALGQALLESGELLRGRSEVITSWRPESSSALKVWKNSSAGLVAAGEELDVVDQDDVRRRGSCSLKRSVRRLADAPDELARELLDRRVAHA